MNTYLYIMELIFIKNLGKLVCDYGTLHNHINGRSLVMEICFNFNSNYIEKDLPACFLTVNSTGACFELLLLNCIW